MRDYQNMFDTPQDRAKERDAIRSYHRRVVLVVTTQQQSLVSGGDQPPTTQRHMKHKGRFIVQGRRVK
jgi:hypothetical protein